MYIKLNFTADKNLPIIYRIVNELINTPAITSVATLVSTATSASWHSSLLANFDAANSEIIRTGTGVTGLTTANTISRYAKLSSNGSYCDDHAWTVEFSKYDNTSSKYYIQHYGGVANSTSSTLKIATGLASGTLSSVTGMSPTYDSFAASAWGTDPTFNSSLYTGGTVITGASGASLNGYRSFVMYISDTCMIWCATLAGTYNVGFGGTYNNSANYVGPFIYSQYNRFDYTNTNNNGILPLMFTNTNRGGGVGFGGAVTDWTTAENNQYNTTSNNIAFRVFNLINSYPTTGASYPIVLQPYVNWGVGSRYSDYAGLTATGAGSTTIATTAAYGPAIFTTVGTRYPSADLKSQTYGMLPVSWRNLYYYNAGGDASAKGGWYCFNGDYFPGDEFTYNGKTYKIIPTYVGYSQRVGIAIPKE